MTIKKYLEKIQTESSVKGFWWYDDFSTFPKNFLQNNFEEFKNLEIKFITDIRNEPIDGMIILKNLTNDSFKKKIRIYSIYLDKGDVFYNISKDSLK